MWRAALAGARPRQWVKNLLVFAAPAAAVVVGHPVTFGRTAGAAILFCLASSGVYFINDVVDAESDRHHPVKCARPVASGEISPAAASTLGGALLVLAIAGGFLVGGAELGVVMLVYGAISLMYSLRLKRVPVVELCCVSAGFVLRTIAGGAAAHIAISPWFLVVSCSGSLLIASGKRTAELMTLDEARSQHRAALAWYRSRFLAIVRQLSALVSVGGYSAWAIARWHGLDDRVHDGPFILLSIVPFTVAVLVLEQALAAGRGGAPEELALRSRSLQAVGALFLTLVVLALGT
ncbi:MAG: decaprenyl-phosphate phosphoribosyltransferase [Acidimicrobiales bacterium]